MFCALPIISPWLQDEQYDAAAVFEAVMTFLEQQWQTWCSADLPVFKQRYVCQHGWLLMSLAMVNAGVFGTPLQL